MDTTLILRILWYFTRFMTDTRRFHSTPHIDTTILDTKFTKYCLQEHQRLLKYKCELIYVRIEVCCKSWHQKSTITSRGTTKKLNERTSWRKSHFANYCHTIFAAKVKFFFFQETAEKEEKPDFHLAVFSSLDFSIDNEEWIRETSMRMRSIRFYQLLAWPVNDTFLFSIWQHWLPVRQDLQQLFKPFFPEHFRTCSFRVYFLSGP